MPKYKQIYHMSMDMEYYRLRIKKLTEELNTIVADEELIMDEDIARMQQITASIREYTRQYAFIKRQIEEYL